MTFRPAKLHLRRGLSDASEVRVPGLRRMQRSDVERLGKLVYAAYLDTVDYEGETEGEAIETVRATFDGRYGPFVDEASVVLEQDGVPVSAAFVTRREGRPLLAFAVTHPDRRGRGLAELCTRAAMHALAAAGDTELHLFVTATNAPARALYRRLGFQPADAGETDATAAEPR